METVDEQSRRILESARSIAVLGARDTPSAAGHYVPVYLAAQGYRVFAINPKLEGESRFGQLAVGALASLPEPVDMVDIFRRPEALPGHLAELLAMRPLPKVVWLQSGIRHTAVAAALEAAGIEVVQDRCTLAEHRRLGLSGHA